MQTRFGSWTRLTVLTASLACTGCAVTPDPASVVSSAQYDAGWRRAVITDVRNAPSAATDDAHVQCQGFTQPHPGTPRIAMTSYSFGGSPTLRNLRLAPAPSDLPLALGSTVLVNILDCSEPLQPL
jgi:hypothetical protein